MFESLLLAIILAADACAATCALAVSGIKIRVSLIHAVNAICVITFGISLFAAVPLRSVLPEMILEAAGGIALLVLGLIKLCGGFRDSVKNSAADDPRGIFSARDVLALCVEPERADIDKSNTISFREAVLLAFALSLDGMAVGFSVGLAGARTLVLLCLVLITGVFALHLGVILGSCARGRLKINTAIASGALLIVLALIRLLV